jgi:hypothetical protein
MDLPASSRRPGVEMGWLAEDEDEDEEEGLAADEMQ